MKFPVRHCAECGEPIPQRRRTTLKEYEKRRYCSPACVTEASRGKVRVKDCLQCGSPIPASRIRPARYAERRFCSHICDIEHRRVESLRSAIEERKRGLLGDAIFAGHRFDDARVTPDYRPLPMRPQPWRTA